MTLSQLQTQWLGDWKNQKGSVMHIASIQHHPGGGNHYLVSGTYKSGVGNVATNQTFPLTGFVIGDMITVCVSYNESGDNKDGASVCAWAGQFLPRDEDLAKKKPRTKQILKTLWHLVPDLDEGEDEDKYGWMIAWAGSDYFTK